MAHMALVHYILNVWTKLATIKILTSHYSWTCSDILLTAVKTLFCSARERHAPEKFFVARRCISIGNFSAKQWLQAAFEGVFPRSTAAAAKRFGPTNALHGVIRQLRSRRRSLDPSAIWASLLWYYSISLSSCSGYTAASELPVTAERPYSVYDHNYGKLVFVSLAKTTANDLKSIFTRQSEKHEVKYDGITGVQTHLHFRLLPWLAGHSRWTCLR